MLLWLRDRARICSWTRGDNHHLLILKSDLEQTAGYKRPGCVFLFPDLYLNASLSGREGVRSPVVQGKEFCLPLK